MKRLFTLLLFLGLSLGIFLNAQTISRDEMVFLTSEWKGERFEDGRPRIPDALIERAAKIGIEEAWVVLYNAGYKNQFEGNWKMIHEDVPVIGRALTAHYMPSRPDVLKNIMERGHAEGRSGNHNSWPIQELQKGDVYVADSFGKIAQGTLIGDSLGTAIYNKTGTGVVFDGSARDRSGMAEIEGFNAFVRDFDPTFLEEVVLMGLNTPIRIGKAIVLPGDLVISEPTGVLFIPAHMAEEVILTAEFIGVRDAFGYEMLKAGTYDTGQMDNAWTDAIKEHFLRWLDENPDQLPMSRKDLDAFMSKRTW
ncbi:RraA family protein [Opitutia bacterium ISCC 51]|nr:RraA family protein [Opitutae bacterium ISCC 51]QXD27561.1 RraA family protein [Opitutae bacterium ISCC 52]